MTGAHLVLERKEFAHELAHTVAAKEHAAGVRHILGDATRQGHPFIDSLLPIAEAHRLGQAVGDSHAVHCLAMCLSIEGTYFRTRLRAVCCHK